MELSLTALRNVVNWNLENSEQITSLIITQLFFRKCSFEFVSFYLFTLIKNVMPQMRPYIHLVYTAFSLSNMIYQLLCNSIAAPK